MCLLKKRLLAAVTPKCVYDKKRLLAAVTSKCVYDKKRLFASEPSSQEIQLVMLPKQGGKSKPMPITVAVWGGWRSRVVFRV